MVLVLLELLSCGVIDPIGSGGTFIFCPIGSYEGVFLWFYVFVDSKVALVLERVDVVVFDIIPSVSF